MVIVLILVFMEVILLPNGGYRNKAEARKCFNPCFYGSYSFTHLNLIIKYLHTVVLILVFMEVILLRII